MEHAPRDGTTSSRPDGTTDTGLPARGGPPRWAGIAATALALLPAASEIARLLQVRDMGVDFEPVRNAASALLRGDSVFSDPYFVYPPTAVPLLLPTVLGSVRTAFVCWVAAGVAALAAAAWMVGRQAPPRRRALVTALALLGMLGGVAAARSISLGNLTVFLAPAAVGILVAFRRGHWTPGCALLAATLLVKPLLAPLVLVPAAHRRWRPLAHTMLPAAALLFAAMLLIPGGTRYPAILHYVAQGTNLHGSNAVNNLSLRGWAEAHALPSLAGTAAAAAVVVFFLVRVTAVRPDPAALSAALLLTTLLASSISEVHYLLVVLAMVLVMLAPQPWRDWLPFAPGIALLALPGPYVPLVLGHQTTGQTWLVLAELLLLTALLTAPRRSIPRHSAP
ncbi:glycosyltransferase family 87 protein [Actinoplanes sp. NBRC 101535]|uniref:glycosyltransferase family 87 protein n=1 Tax=Actinoplanes sp. NBRC 101535 TaxID=3032196 RepID=UPI00249FBCA5|nr:glycosyltransferase family 87 protein [Actinoplanes sp. NBRC 101535]GLX99939.1 hypothetical protein Acsp01_03190 [Actinoplanes sp. NBRC 101535]